jgi:predicted flap endonuclease-1-like 5' DNA nuclease
MNTTVLIVIAVLVVAALLFLLVVRGRKQHVTFSDQTPLARSATPVAKATADPEPAAPVEGHGVASEVAAAIEDVVDQFVGIDAHPSGQSEDAAGDPLTRLKGLGPKAASRLAEIGVTRFDQIAAWDEADIDAIDAQMGAFKGRIRRDRWVDQARLLAAGDTGAFETEFGKLGG